ncbi:MAG: hypothetical protein IKS20_00440, partial [Victivallales bacterium]|nr:hypothetical protein [Victivallales bacterium]
VARRTTGENIVSGNSPHGEESIRKKRKRHCHTDNEHYNIANFIHAFYNLKELRHYEETIHID